MPNHVTNVLYANEAVLAAITRPPTEEEIKAKAEDQAELRRRYKEREGKDWPYPEEFLPELLVEFEMVVPPPENLERGGCPGGAVSGIHADGSVCWYEWNIQNWGTKWGAYSVEKIEGGVRFDTAWSHPQPVIKALSRKFPEDEIVVEYADEDLGHNLGAYTVIDGEYQMVDFPEEGTDEAREWACQLKYGQSYAELYPDEEEESE